jgi:DNA helicase HerA-like ATPase
MNAPRLYAVFLLWMLSELFENLPEVGDLDKPKLVFFFDEAHLLFAEAPKALLQKIEQVVRLIRSKGVGVFFVTQNPLDIPDTVLGQLGNRVQHALRAYTPRDQKAVKAAAETFRPNPCARCGAGDHRAGRGRGAGVLPRREGRPQPVQRASSCRRRRRSGRLMPMSARRRIAGSVVAGVYEKTVDRESAYEKLHGRVVANAQTAPTPAASGGGAAPPQQSHQQQSPQQSPQQPPAESGGSLFGDVLGGLFGSSSRRDSPVQAMVKSAARSIGSQVGREIIRGVLGSILKKR